MEASRQPHGEVAVVRQVPGKQACRQSRTRFGRSRQAGRQKYRYTVRQPDIRPAGRQARTTACNETVA